MKPKTNTTLIVICTLLVAAGAYWYFFMGSKEQPPLTAVTSGSATQAKFQALVAELQPISFDTRIFSDSRFMALVDLTTPITPETSGRIDPFAPVSGISASDSVSAR